MANISYYGSHNAAIAVEDKGKLITVIEIERFLGYKNMGVAQYKTPRHKNENDFYQIVTDILSFIKKEYSIEKYDTCVMGNTDVVIGNTLFQTHEIIPADNFVSYTHHLSHAAGVFYQSPFDEAIIFSFDGGGNDGFFNVYHCIKGEEPRLLEHIRNPHIDSPHVGWDLGFPYMLIGHYLKDIRYECLSEGNLVYSGKLMGLVSYGNVREEWKDAFINLYRKGPNGENYRELMNELGEKIGVKFDENETSRLEGQIAYDIAATSQWVFEECFLSVARPYFELFPFAPVCVAGGCGLNILLNTRLVKEFKLDLFVGPNPNDCGLAVGQLANLVKPEEPWDVTYMGLPLLDRDMLQYYFNHSNWFKDNLVMSEVVDDLADGKIVGVVRGRSEHGPRALGNRSILCNPSLPEMKDILNSKVKNREWYRPFAPVVRLEDVNKYFEFKGESRWMTFAPIVRKRYRNKLAAITHIDNTARVQTVTREQNPWLYDLITEFKKKTGIGVLLNTSFNVNGMPILTTLKDALHVYETTQMDTLVIEDIYIRKHI